jgi:hypothetical protein
MARLVANLLISAAVIAFATWLSKRHPDTAGFVTALPITTMLVLVLGRADGIELAQQAAFARSLILAIPLSASFLVPFVVAPRVGLSFWTAFAAGIVMLGAGYALHRTIVGGA